MGEIRLLDSAKLLEAVTAAERSGDGGGGGASGEEAGAAADPRSAAAALLSLGTAEARRALLGACLPAWSGVAGAGAAQEEEERLVPIGASGERPPSALCVSHALPASRGEASPALEG